MSTENIKIISKHRKRGLSFIIRETQVKATVIYSSEPSGMAKMKKTANYQLQAKMQSNKDFQSLEMQNGTAT
jgi:hypothetical protein